VAEGKKLPISVVISAVDNVTYRVMAINEKIKKITAPVAKVQAAFKTLGDEAGIGKLGKAIGKVGSTGKEFFGELAGAVMKIATVGLAAAGAIFGVVHSFSEAGDEVSTLAARLGLTTDAYQELSYAAKLADVDQETFNSSMQKLSKGTAEAAAGQGEAMIAYNALGISVRDSTGHLRSMESLLPEIAEKMKKVQNQSLRNALATKFFGREGMKLNGIFQEGAEGLDRLRKEARDVGAVMTPDQIKAAEKFDDAFKSISSTLLMVRNIVGAALAPVLVNLGKTLQTYILGNKDKIEAFAAAFAANLPGYLEQLWNLFKGIASALMPVVQFVGWLADAFGGTSVAVAALLLYFAPLVSSFIAFAGALSGLVVPALTFAYTAFSLLWTVISAVVTGLAALVGWPVTVGLLLGAAAVMLYKKWEPFQRLIDGIWGSIKGLFGGSTTIKGELSTSQNSTPALGPAVGFGKTVDAAQRSSSTKNENSVLVEFANMPAGTRVEKKKDEGGLDLAMGYGMAGGIP
jgi:hypothetical protein